MSASADGEADVELEVQLCRCRASAELADKLHGHFEDSGLRVTRGANPSRLIELTMTQVLHFNLKRFRAARTSAPAAGQAFYGGQPTAFGLGGVAARGQEAVAEFVLDKGRRMPTTAAWMPVFDVRTFIRTGAELYVSSEMHADSQLATIAPALGIPREEITVKPPPGWRGYGHPDLFPETPGRR